MTEELKSFVNGLIDWVTSTGVSIVLKVIAALLIMLISLLLSWNLSICEMVIEIRRKEY